MSCVIGIDIGTTHIKSILFDGRGEAVLEEKRETPLKKDGESVYYDPEEIFGVVRGQLISLCMAAREKIAGISVTGMAEAGLIVNRETGREETEILPWFDRRTRALAGRMTEEDNAAVFRTTGLANSYKYGIYKFLWLLENRAADKKSAIWLSMCDYVVFRLTGEYVTEPGFAARTYVYDIVNGRWDGERIAAYGLTEENFPKVLPSGASAGVYRDSALSHGEIPVAVAGHDHVCAAFGLLYHDRSAVCDSAGTSETYIGLLPEEGRRELCFTPEPGLLYGPFPGGGFYYMANVPSAGHSVEWYLKKLQLASLSYEEMNRRLSALPEGPTGLFYYPYLTGMGAPLYEAEMKGALLGLTQELDGWTVLKGILEGIQYQAAWLLKGMAEHCSAGVRRLVCAGGLAKNETIMQLKADILGASVAVPAQTEATLCGACALFLERSAGRREVELFTERFLTPERAYVPDPLRAAEYEKLLREKYIPFVQALRNFYCG